MKFNIHSKLNQAALALALIVSAASCNDKDTPTPTLDQASVSVINLLDGVAEVNAHVGATKVNTATFKFATFDKYHNFKAAKANLSIFENTKTDTLAAAKNYDFKATEAYSAYVIGTATAAEVVVIKDDLKAGATGKAKIRLANFINGTDKLDLFLGSSTDETADDIAFKSVNAFAEVNAATVTLKIKAEGATADLATLENAKLEAGKIYTVLAYQTKVDGVAKPAIKLIAQK